MKITLNGESLDIAVGTSLAQLIAQHDLIGKRYAVERNREIVPKSQIAEVVLVEGDIIEIVFAVGGG